MQQQLSPVQKASFFINAFSGPARTHFFQNADHNMTYDTLCELMRKEYDSDARHRAVQSELEKLRIEKFMYERDITAISQGLTSFVDQINSLAPQCPNHFRHDSNKTRFLRAAVVGHPWASRTIRQITTLKFTFHIFVTALQEGIQLHEEESKHYTSTVLPTNYQRYGREPPRRDFNPSIGRSFQPSKTPIGRHNKVLRCSTCGADDHLHRNFRTGNVMSRIQGRIRNGVPAVHVVQELAADLQEILDWKATTATAEETHHTRTLPTMMQLILQR